MNTHVPYYDYGLTPYPQDRKRYTVYQNMPEEQRKEFGRIGQEPGPSLEQVGHRRQCA